MSQRRVGMKTHLEVVVRAEKAEANCAAKDAALESIGAGSFRGASNFAVAEDWQGFAQKCQTIARQALSPNPGAALLAVVEAAQKCREIRLDAEEFDGDRRGHWGALEDAEKVLDDTLNDFDGQKEPD